MYSRTSTWVHCPQPCSRDNYKYLTTTIPFSVFEQTSCTLWPRLITHFTTETLFHVEINCYSTPNRPRDDDDYDWCFTATFVPSGGSAHLAYLVQKSGRKTPIIIFKWRYVIERGKYSHSGRVLTYQLRLYQHTNIRQSNSCCGPDVGGTGGCSRFTSALAAANSS